jgi:hypothetical protein
MLELEHATAIGGVAEEDFDPTVENAVRPGDRFCNDALNYAWRYYEYHCIQRVHLFRFFLLTSLAVCVGYFHATVEVGREPVWSFVVALIGWFIAFVFRRLDDRSVDLISLVEKPLMHIESQLESQYAIPGINLLRRGSLQRESLHSFRTLIPLFIGVFKYLALGALLFSIYHCLKAYALPSSQAAVGWCQDAQLVASRLIDGFWAWIS